MGKLESEGGPDKPGDVFASGKPQRRSLTEVGGIAALRDPPGGAEGLPLPRFHWAVRG